MVLYVRMKASAPAILGGYYLTAENRSEGMERASDHELGGQVWSKRYAFLSEPPFPQQYKILLTTWGYYKHRMRLHRSRILKDCKLRCKCKVAFLFKEKYNVASDYIELKQTLLNC